VGWGARSPGGSKRQTKKNGQTDGGNNHERKRRSQNSILIKNSTQWPQRIQPPTPAAKSTGDNEKKEKKPWGGNKSKLSASQTENTGEPSKRRSPGKGDMNELKRNPATRNPH